VNPDIAVCWGFLGCWKLAGLPVKTRLVFIGIIFSSLLFVTLSACDFLPLEVFCMYFGDNFAATAVGV